MSGQRHVIQRQIWELTVDSDTEVHALQNRVSALVRSRIVRRIEAICDRSVPPDLIYRLDRLEIDLGEIPIDSLETELVEKVAEALSERLSPTVAGSPSPNPAAPPPPRAIAPTRSVSSTRPLTADLDRFREFLYTGRLPWWSEPLDRNGLEACLDRLLNASPDRLALFFQRALQSEKVVQRLLYQFSEPTLDRILALLSPALQPVFPVYRRETRYLLSHLAVFPRSDPEPSDHLPEGGFSERLSDAEGIPIPRELDRLLWRGLFEELARSTSFPYPSTETEIDAVLRANLAYIAGRFPRDGRSFARQLLSTLETLSASGHSFDRRFCALVAAFALGRDSGENHPKIPVEEATEPDTVARTLDRPEMPAPRFQDGNSDESEDLYLQNAGLILLWPFLDRFFVLLGLACIIHEAKNKNPPKKIFSSRFN